jgi:hypothetical protein
MTTNASDVSFDHGQGYFHGRFLSLLLIEAANTPWAAGRAINLPADAATTVLLDSLQITCGSPVIV